MSSGPLADTARGWGSDVEKKPLSSVVPQKAEAAGGPGPWSWECVRQGLSHLVLVLQQGLGSWALTLLGWGRPIRRSP